MTPFFKIDHAWVLFLLPVALIGFFILKKKYRERAVINYPPMQDKNSGFKRSWPIHTATIFEILILIIAFLALSGPYRAFEIVSIDEEGIDVMLTLDISASMQAKDFPPNRLDATKAIVDEFLRRSGGNRVGAVVFGKRVYTLSPLTSDHTMLRKIISGLSLDTIDHYQSGGTAIGDAVLYSVDALRAVKITDRSQVIIMLTDGENNDGSEPTLAAKFATAHNIKVHTIGLGSTTPVTVIPDPSQPDWTFDTMLTEETLVQMAHATQGRYFPAEDKNMLAGVFDELSRLERTPLRTASFEQKKYFRQPLHASLALLFIGLILLRVFFLRRPLK